MRRGRSGPNFWGRLVRRSLLAGLITGAAIGAASPPSALAAVDVVDEWTVHLGQLPHGLATDDGGNVYVSTFEDREPPGTAGVLKYDSDGTLLDTIGVRGDGVGQLQSPTRLATDGSNALFVVDAGRILKFGLGGSFLDQWDIPGGEPSVNDIAADSAGHVYVIIDRPSPEVLQFDGEGDLLDTWAVPPASGSPASPQAIDTDAEGEVFVADSEAHRVITFDSGGDVLRSWPIANWSVGPFALSVDAHGDVYTTGGFVTHKLDADGTVLDSWINGGAGEGMDTYTEPDGDTQVYAGALDPEDGYSIWKFGTVPFDTVIVSPGRYVGATPTIEFSAGNADATFECSPNYYSGPWTPCASPLTLPPQSDGGHHLRVRARDDASGYVDRTPAVVYFIVDTILNAEITVAKRQQQPQNEVAVTVDGHLSPPDDDALFETSGRVVVAAKRQRLTFPLAANRVGIPSDWTERAVLRPVDAAAVERISKALNRGRAVRARVKASITDDVGHVVEMRRTVRLLAAKR